MEYEWTGIGLPNNKKIVNQHSGNICVESELGKVTIFYSIYQTKAKNLF